MRVTPMAVNSAVSTGWSHEVGTKLMAARLYTSSGWTSSRTLLIEYWSSRSAWWIVDAVLDVLDAVEVLRAGRRTMP